MRLTKPIKIRIWHSFILIILILFHSVFFISNPRNTPSSNPLSYYESDIPNNSILSASEVINITLLSPENQSIVTGGTLIQIEFRAENGSLLTPLSALYRWDYGPNFEAILRPLPFADGSHVLEVQAESNDGIWSESTFVFYSDNTPPTILLLNPDNGSHRLGGGGEIFQWDTASASGSLDNLELTNVTGDSIPDIVTGGGSGVLYAFEGRYGNALWVSPSQTAPISEITAFNETVSVFGLTDGKFRVFNNSDVSIFWTNSSVSSSVVEIESEEALKALAVLNQYELRLFNFSGQFLWNYSFPGTDPQQKLILNDVMGNSRPEILTVNQTSHVTLFNFTTGIPFVTYGTPGFLEDVLIENEFLYISTTAGLVSKYVAKNGTLKWATTVESGFNIYQISSSLNGIVGTSSNGKVFLLNDTNGNILWNVQGSSSFIKHLIVSDFDKDGSEEIVIFDGADGVHNFDSSDGSENWQTTDSRLKIEALRTGDLNNNTYLNLVGASTDAHVFLLDPRDKIPKLTPSLTNVSFQFDDAIGGNVTLWEKYSWDGGLNQSTPGQIPTTSGTHTLDVWIADNASNVAAAHYKFFASLDIHLNDPLNNSVQQSGTDIDLTFSESPLEVSYKWDAGAYIPALSPLPIGEVSHDLDIRIRDQSQNDLDFHYRFITDDTPIGSIILITPQNDTLVEGGTNVTIQFSEPPFFVNYSWNSQPNQTTLSNVPFQSDTHILEVYAADAAFNWKTARNVFHTKIRIALLSHSNNSVIDPFSILRFEFGENPDYYEYQLDTLPSVGFTDQNQTLNFTMVAESETHTLIIRANDSSNGKWNNETYLFIVRINVSLTSHQDGGFAETGEVLIFDFSDVPVTALYSWDGQWNSSYLRPVPSPDGDHFLDVHVGNIEGMFWHYHYEFFVDTDLIDILLIRPTNNTRITSAENITIQFNETPYILEYSWNNGTINTTLPEYPDFDGGHNLTVTAVDVAGNGNTKVFYWIIDDTPINISIIGTLNQSTVFTGSMLNVSFNQELPVIEWYHWDAHDVSPVLPPVPFGNGTHLLHINVSDGLNWNYQSFEFTVIDPPPSLEFLEMGSPMQSGTILTITVNETLSQSWHKWDNGSQIEGIDNVVCPDDEGSHTLIVFVTDLGGSYRQRDFLITVDNTPISILRITPPNGSTVVGGVNITFEFSETPFRVDYSWNGAEFSEILTSVPTKLGKHVLAIRCFDEAGNLLDVIVNYTVFEPTVLRPEDAPLFIAGAIIVAGVPTGLFLKRDKIRSIFKPVQRE